MRVMALFDQKGRMHHNPGTNFYGNDRQKVLSMKIFPWIDKVTEAPNLSVKTTARGFLNYMINLRWVILQDCAVIIGKNERKHFIFDNIKDIF